MNKIIWISIISSLIITLFMALASFKKDIETPDYKVIKTYGDVEIRLYPKMIIAKTLYKIQNL